MLPEWPSTLPPSPLIEGYFDTPQDSVLRTQMTGLNKQRNRYTAKLNNVEEKYLLTEAQMAVFENFYDNTLGNGALEFAKQDPRLKQERVYRFAGPYDMDYNGKQYLVTLSLEKMP